MIIVWESKKKAWNENIKVDMKRFGLVKEDAQNRDRCRSLTTANRPTLPQCGNEGLVLYGFHSHDI